jgi:hypothetical protein
MARHTSAETRESELTATWTPQGRGPFVYRLAAEELARRNIDLIDCTPGGALSITKGRLEECV